MYSSYMLNLANTSGIFSKRSNLSVCQNRITWIITKFFKVFGSSNKQKARFLMHFIWENSWQLSWTLRIERTSCFWISSECFIKKRISSSNGYRIPFSTWFIHLPLQSNNLNTEEAHLNEFHLKKAITATFTSASNMNFPNTTVIFIMKFPRVSWIESSDLLAIFTMHGRRFCTYGLTKISSTLCSWFSLLCIPTKKAK